MPVLDTCGNVYDASWQQLDSFLFPFLIISSAAYADKHLSAAAFCIVDMPVVAAGRFKGDIENGYLLGGNGSKVAVADKVLSVGVRFAYREEDRCGILFFLGYCSCLLVQTSFARRKTAQAFGQPTYIAACVMIAAISSLVTPFALALAR